MLIDGQSLSLVGTVVHLAERYNKIKNTNLSGQEVLELAKQGDEVSSSEAKLMFQSLAKAIYNLQYSFDPEKFIIGGGVSKNPYFLEQLRKSIQELVKEVEFAPIVPEIVAAKFHNDANLIGAANSFEQLKKVKSV
ncbi:hypothetical protein XA3_00150 [Xylocopilactobacillus apicola]|uniref:ROK family protein n=2 Tax=Xylocopilactobacillus apicola TaxID=2932184 RepID=A0AAU9DP66_9LACO|nr:hypothetical protein XA3_00150 [Xylocopilactobacillus apicola]